MIISVVEALLTGLKAARRVWRRMLLSKSLHVLSGFRRGSYDCLNARAVALFELSDALLCTDGPVRSRVELSSAPEHHRSHGGLHDAINAAGSDVEATSKHCETGWRYDRCRAAGGRFVPAVDDSAWG